MKTRLILGGPGAGKTTRLLQIMEDELGAGVEAHRIAFVSFTKKATCEALDRAMEKFSLSKRDLPYFRTLHSMCYMKTSSRSSNIMGSNDYIRIADRLGVIISKGIMSPDDSASMQDGDRMVYMDNLARNTGRDLEEIWVDHGQPFHFGRLQQWAATCREYKELRSKWDFTDLLHEYVAGGIPVPVDVAIIDEAQDLTPLEWQVVEIAFQGVERRYIAGDDDQAIYTWSGADVAHFLSVEHDEQEVLPVSYRLPTAVFDYAKSFAGSRIKNRYDKEWQARPENGEGFVKWISSLDEVDVTEGSWYLLARNSCFLTEYADHLRDLGMVYQYRRKPSVNPDNREIIYLYERWSKGVALDMADTYRVVKKMGIHRSVKEGKHYLEDYGNINAPWYSALKNIDPTIRAYYRSVMKRYRSLRTEPTVEVNTVHAVKGGEADYAVLSTDMTKRSFEGDAEDEARVFYVGATRVK